MAHSSAVLVPTPLMKCSGAKNNLKGNNGGGGGYTGKKKGFNEKAQGMKEDIVAI